MKKMTEGNLWAAFAGESQAHMKYLAFAEKARKEGMPNIARLFQAISYAEQIHATKHLDTLGGIGNTVENLGAALAGENFEVDSMYPAYAAVAKQEEEKRASLSIDYALEAEKTHAGLYTAAKKAAEAKTDASLGKIQICSVCGWTVEGEAPDRCPVCAALKDKFVSF
jgi:rubrerythrin